MTRRLRMLALVLIYLGISCGGVARGAGPATQPTTAPAHAQMDSELIRRTGDGSAPASGAAPRSSGMELSRVAMALALVIGLIFALRWAVKKFFISGSSHHSTKAVQLLSRSSISPQSRETWLLLMPSIPIAFTRSSTERVEMP